MHHEKNKNTRKNEKVSHQHSLTPDCNERWIRSVDAPMDVNNINTKYWALCYTLSVCHIHTAVVIDINTTVN